MRTTATGLLLALCLALAGCAPRTEDYLEVVRGQQKVMQEITDILKKVQNDKDMAAAKDALDERFAEYEAIARKGRELPKPPPPEVQEKLDLASLNRVVRQMNDEIQRVKDLPGGRDFFAQFGGHTALLQSVE
jgi:biopolymer transport protein ExbB/TolQ